MSDNSELKTIAYLINSMRRALLGEVTPNLRGATARLTEDGAHCRFIYDIPITAEIRELVEDVETEIIADYSGLTPVACVTEYLSPVVRPTLADGEHWVFRRKEAADL
jgi:hypothetical protein